MYIFTYTHMKVICSCNLDFDQIRCVSGDLALIRTKMVALSYRKFEEISEISYFHIYLLNS